VHKYRKSRSTEIAERLLEELNRLADPDQDNISFTIIKVNDASARPKENRPPRPSMAVARPKRLTTVATEPMLLPLKLSPDEDGRREVLSAAPPESAPAPDAGETVAADDQPTVTPRRVATLR